MFHNAPSRRDIIMALFIFKRSTNRHLGVFLASVQLTPLTRSFLSIYLLIVVVLSSRFVESAVITMLVFHKTARLSVWKPTDDEPRM